ncbi:MAG TPA: carbohydrate binding domain-containing protein, partial [Polyangiaceae bacterium]|nr:carbohydrate binding domain-containing protein [Polyangiaceae bacterium]
ADHLQEARPTSLDLASPADAGPDAANRAAPELLPNASFEGGHAGWMGFGDSRILDVADAHTGSRSILSTNRQWTWEGPGYDIRSLVIEGEPYAVSAWVRNEFESDSIILTLKTQCSGDETYTRLATRAVGADWLSIDASFFAPGCAELEVLEELVIYVEGPAAHKNLLVDDVSLRSAPVATSASAN